GPREGGKPRGHAVDDALAVALLDGLGLAPQADDLVHVAGGALAEYVRVPALELVGLIARDVLHAEGVAVGAELPDRGVEEHLEQHVAELLPNIVRVTRLDRVDELVRLL